MDLSSLIASNPEVKVKIKNTDRLFYDQYSYGLSLVMFDFCCLRTAVQTSSTLSEVFDAVKIRYSRRRRWRDWFAGFTTGMPCNSDIDPAIFAKETENLIDISSALFQHKGQFKLVLSGDHGYVYTNSLDLLNSLIKKPYVVAKQFYQAKIVRQKDTITLRRSSHRYRSYFNDCRVSDSEHHNLSEYLFSQSDWRMSPSLQRWCRSSLPWVQRGHFVDHNNKTEIAMLSLIKAGIIRKTMPIVEVNNSTNHTPGN